jgi:hypothetical protein
MSNNRLSISGSDGIEQDGSRRNSEPKRTKMKLAKYFSHLAGFP